MSASQPTPAAAPAPWLPFALAVVAVWALEGKLLDDGTIARLGEQSFRLTSAEASLRWLAMNSVGMQLSVTEVTDQVAALSLQGPKSRAILNRCCQQSVDALKFFRMAPNSLQGILSQLTH